jgi:hypothetical protein
MKFSNPERILHWLVGQVLKMKPNADPVLVRTTMKRLLDDTEHDDVPPSLRSRTEAKP